MDDLSIEGVMKLRFYGASDDLVECEGDTTGEIGCYDYSHVDIRLKNEDGRITLLRFAYDSKVSGCWGVEVAPIEEGIPMLAVSISGAQSGYSALVEVDDVDRAEWRLETGAWEVPS